MNDNPRVNKLLDFVERVSWTAIQAAAGAGLVALTMEAVTWEIGLKFVGVTTLAAVLKVLAAQQLGSSDMGDAIPGGNVIEPPPKDSNA